MNAPDRLGAATRAYRDAGLPWTAAEFDPAPPVRDEENFVALFREVRGEIGRGTTASASAVEGFARAADRPRLDFGHKRDLGRDLLCPEYAAVKSGVNLLALRAGLRAADGNEEGALADLGRILHLALLIETDANLTATALGLAFERIALRAAVGIGEGSPSMRRAVVATMTRGTAPHTLEPPLRGEAFAALASARREGEPEGSVARTLETWTDFAARLRGGTPAPMVEFGPPLGGSAVMDTVVFGRFAEIGAAMREREIERGRMLERLSP